MVSATAPCKIAAVLRVRGKHRGGGRRCQASLQAHLPPASFLMRCSNINFSSSSGAFCALVSNAWCVQRLPCQQRRAGSQAGTPACRLQEAERLPAAVPWSRCQVQTAAVDHAAMPPPGAALQPAEHRQGCLRRSSWRQQATRSRQARAAQEVLLPMRLAAHCTGSRAQAAQG